MDLNLGDRIILKEFNLTCILNISKQTNSIILCNFLDITTFLLYIFSKMNIS